jgi:hypothetical protein
LDVRNRSNFQEEQSNEIRPLVSIWQNNRTAFTAWMLAKVGPRKSLSQKKLLETMR